MERHYLTFTIGETVLAIPLESVDAVLDHDQAQPMRHSVADRQIDLPSELGMTPGNGSRKPMIVIRSGASGSSERVALVVDTVRTLVSVAEDQVFPLRAPAESHLYAAARSVLRTPEGLIIVLDLGRLTAMA